MKTLLKQYLGGFHDKAVHERRVSALCDHLAPLLENANSVVDLGCGDGRITLALSERLPAVRFRAFDLPPLRPNLLFPVAEFDGKRIPLADDSVDAVILVDVLHHAEDAFALLTEARRVAKSALIIKDHRLSKPGAAYLLRFMDWAGNWTHDVHCPHHYWSEAQWKSAWDRLGLKVAAYRTDLGLYPKPFRPLFDDGLHFIARLEKCAP
jgi:SAM-dependent methyltransferase